jgi:hypothetical protein
LIGQRHFLRTVMTGRKDKVRRLDERKR